MNENMPVSEFNKEFSEKEIELIDALREKGFCSETQVLFCAWQDAEQSKPEWGQAKDSREDASLILQARLDLRKAKILNGAGFSEEANMAWDAVDIQVAQMKAAGIDCSSLWQE